MKKAVLAAALVASAGGCTSEAAQGSEQTTLTVFAAASLTDTFTTIGAAFEKDHPGVTVRFSFAGSPTLAQQIVSGAPADVFAAASPATMATLSDDDLVAGTPTVFAHNRLELAVPPGSHKVRSLRDAVATGTALAVCAPAVPCGAAAATLLAAEQLVAHPVTEEQDVKSVLAKVELGEADCGLVYATDVRAAHGQVDGIELPDLPAARATYPIATVAGSKHQTVAAEFVAAVTGAAGQAALRAAGFLPAT